MHRLCVYVYVACVVPPRVCMHHLWLLYLVRIYTEARPEPPPRRVLFMCRMSALSHDSYLHLFRPPSRSVIPPSRYPIAHGSVRCPLSLPLRSPVSLIYIYFARPLAMQYTRFPFFSRLVCTDVYRSARYCDNDAVCRYQTRHPPQRTECACMYMLPVYCTHMSACTACGYCIQIAYVPKRGLGRRPAAFYCCITCLHSPMTPISISFAHHPAL